MTTPIKADTTEFRSQNAATLYGKVDANGFSGNIYLDPAALADHEGRGVIIPMDVDANTVGIGGVLNLAADGSLDDADNDSDLEGFGMALASGTGVKPILVYGIMRDDSWSLTPGKFIYVGDAGGFIEDGPAATHYSHRIGQVLTSHIVFVWFSLPIIQI